MKKCEKEYSKAEIEKIFYTKGLVTDNAKKAKIGITKLYALRKKFNINTKRKSGNPKIKDLVKKTKGRRYKRFYL